MPCLHSSHAAVGIVLRVSSADLCDEQEGMMKASFLTSIGDLFGDLARAHRAVDAYERLNSLSDRSLAARGLRRGDLPGVAFEAAFGKQGR